MVIKVVGLVTNNPTAMAALPVLEVLVVLQEVLEGLGEDSEVTLNEKVLVGMMNVTPSVHDIECSVQAERYSSCL